MPATDTCRWCHGTGWATLIDYDGSGYDVPCPGDCPPADLTLPRRTRAEVIDARD